VDLPALRARERLRWRERVERPLEREQHATTNARRCWSAVGERLRHTCGGWLRSPHDYSTARGVLGVRRRYAGALWVPRFGLRNDEPDGWNAVLRIGRLLDKLRALVRPLLRRVLKR